MVVASEEPEAPRIPEGDVDPLTWARATCKHLQIQTASSTSPTPICISVSLTMAAGS
jgi:hypothetical protein